VYGDCVNIFGIVKFALLKFSVGLVVLQGLVSQFMIESGKEPFNDDNTWSAQQKTERGYCKSISSIALYFLLISLVPLFVVVIGMLVLL
jgi:hypothetical protein